MRKLLLATLGLGLALAATARDARADVGLGLFLGEPTGLDVKVGLGPRTALDILFGYNTFDDGRVGYGHVTYLVNVYTGQGDSVNVPIRIGIGGAVLGPGDDLNGAIRAPFELGLRLRSVPLEFYGELAAVLRFRQEDLDIQGGLGFRIMF